MRKYDISASSVVQDFNRRGIAPDWQHEVEQGILRLWRINNNLIAELYIDSNDGESIPGTIKITGRSMYVNTLAPQNIAEDLMQESKLSKVDLDLIKAMPTQTTVKWLTTVEIEEIYGLAKGSVRRDIHRKKFQAHEIKKIGRDWTVDSNAAERIYNKAKLGSD